MKDQEFAAKERELEKLYEKLSVFTKGRYRSIGYLRRVFRFLRSDPRLCEIPKYKALYEECLYYFFLKKEVEDGIVDFDRQKEQETLEFIADLTNQTGFFDQLPQAEIDAYILFKETWSK